jgi:hypothetical protein
MSINIKSSVLRKWSQELRFREFESTSFRQGGRAGLTLSQTESMSDPVRGAIGQVKAAG